MINPTGPRPNDHLEKNPPRHCIQNTISLPNPSTVYAHLHGLGGEGGKTNLVSAMQANESTYASNPRPKRVLPNRARGHGAYVSPEPQNILENLGATVDTVRLNTTHEGSTPLANYTLRINAIYDSEFHGTEIHRQRSSSRAW